MPDVDAVPPSAPSRPALDRAIGARQFFTLAFGTIIGVGWIIFLGAWIGSAGPLGAVIGFSAGTLLIALVGLCYAEMAAAFPVSGGELAYAYEAFGPKLGFLTGWILAFAYTAIVAWEAISLGLLAENLIPGIGGSELYRVAGTPIRSGSLALGLLATVFFTALNYRGVRWTARFQEILTFSFLALCVVFIGAGFAFGDISNLEPLLRRSADGAFLPGLIAVMVTVPFFMAGFDAIPQAMEERAPGTSPRAAARMIQIAILAAGIFYVLVILAASMVVPWERLVEFEQLPAAAAFEAAFDSPLIARIVLLAGLLGVLTTFNAVFLAASRVVFALGRARLVPPVFARIEPRFESPSAAVLFVGGLGMLGVTLGQGAIGPIVNMTAMCFGLAYAMVSYGVIRLRRRRPELERPYRLPGGILTGGLAVLASLGFVFLAAREPYRSADGLPLEWALLLVGFVLGGVFWLAASRWRGSVDEDERRRLVLGD